MGGWRYVEWVAAPLVFVSVLLCSAVIELSIAGILHADVAAGQIRAAILDATYVVGIIALIARFFRERGAERSRVAWIIAGFAIGLGAKVATDLSAPYANIYTGIPGTYHQPYRFFRRLRLRYRLRLPSRSFVTAL